MREIDYAVFLALSAAYLALGANSPAERTKNSGDGNPLEPELRRSKRGTSVGLAGAATNAEQLAAALHRDTTASEVTIGRSDDVETSPTIPVPAPKMVEAVAEVALFEAQSLFWIHAHAPTPRASTGAAPVRGAIAENTEVTGTVAPGRLIALRAEDSTQRETASRADCGIV